jgi:hypothetical protein
MTGGGRGALPHPCPKPLIHAFPPSPLPLFPAPPRRARSDVWVALITFLYLDFLDATSTMFTIARMVDDQVPGFVNDKGMWPRQLETMVGTVSS